MESSYFTVITIEAIKQLLVHLSRRFICPSFSSFPFFHAPFPVSVLEFFSLFLVRDKMDI